KERVVSAGKIHGLRSRSSSANSSSECTSPTYSPNMNSSILQCHDSSNNWSISSPPLNAERQLETNKSTLANKYNDVRNHTHEINLRANVKDSEFVDKLKSADQCDKKFNSKELIQKQKNWTSHFSKTRTNRYNSDPDKLVVKTSLDKTVLKNKSDEGPQHGSKDSYELENTLENKLPTTNTVKNVNTAERSASFSAMCSSSKTFSSRPQLPTRYSSNCEKKKKKPIACLSVENNELPKFSMLNDIPNNSRKEIPEYAVVQKNVMDKKLDDLPIISLKQCQVESKINSTDTIHACDYEIFQEICADPKNHVAKNNVHITIDNADYLLSSTIKSPLKTLEKEKKLLTTKEEIANDVIKYSTTQQSFDKRELCNKVNENNINALKSCTTKYESDTKPLNSDNVILSYMSTSSSPSEKKREEKAERKASEKLKYGKDSYDAYKDSSKYKNLKTDNSDSYSEINLSSVKRFFNICTDTSTIDDKQIHLCRVCNENSTICEPNEPKSNINESLDLNFINSDDCAHSNIKDTMDISNNLSCTFAFHGKNCATNNEDLNTLDYSSDISKNLSSFIDLKNNECSPNLLPTMQNTNVIEAKEFNISFDESEVLETCITDCHFQTENIIEIDKANETDLAMELLKHDNISRNVFKQKNQFDYNILYKKKTKGISHNSTKNVKESSIKNNENDGKLLLEVENKQAINKKPVQNNTETQSSTIALDLDTSSMQSNKDNLST
ncbi:hypothetical protein TSAR_009473, partial [Trichomalopsis sarcophagae]